MLVATLAISTSPSSDLSMLSYKPWQEIYAQCAVDDEQGTCVSSELTQSEQSLSPCWLFIFYGQSFVVVGLSPSGGPLQVTESLFCCIITESNIEILVLRSNELSWIKRWRCSSNMAFSVIYLLLLISHFPHFQNRENKKTNDNPSSSSSGQNSMAPTKGSTIRLYSKCILNIMR